MNGNIIKGVLIFGAGLAIGAFGAIKITKNKYEAIVQEEIDSIKDKLGKSRTGAEKPKIEEETEEETSATIARRREERRSHREMVGKLGYSDEADEEAPVEEDDEEYRKWERRSEAANHLNDTEPYVITFDQFNNEMDHYSKISLTYYFRDNTVAEENDEIMEDVDFILGDGALVSFGIGSDDDDIVYIRNNRLEIDYEILRVDKSYAEEVGGMNDI